MTPPLPPLVVPLFVALCAPPMADDESLKVEGEYVLTVTALPVTIHAPDVEGLTFKSWHYPATATVEIRNDNRELLIRALPPGDTMIWGDFGCVLNGEAQPQFTRRVMLRNGLAPRPPPDPVDPVDPNPPGPGSKLVILEESGQRTPDQFDLYREMRLDPQLSPQVTILDKDQPQAEPYNPGNVPLPVVFVCSEDGKPTGPPVKLPATVAELKDLLSAN